MIARFGVLCGLLLMTAGLPGQDDMPWKETTYEEEGFTVLAPPGNTANSSNTRTTKYGTSQVNVHVVSRGNDGYGSGTQLYPPKTTKGKSVEQMLDLTRNESLEDLKGRLVSEKKIKLDKKYSGRELRIVASDGKIWRNRVYWANQKMYMVAVMGSDAFVDSPDAEKFLNSFKLTPKAK